MPKKIPLKPRQTSVYLDSFPDWAVLDLKIRRKLCNKLAEYKRRIKEKGLEFKLTQKQFWDLLFADCFYCGSGAPNVKEYKFNEIDRLSSKEGYTPENCTTACRLCNKLKVKTITSLPDNLRAILDLRSF